MKIASGRIYKQRVIGEISRPARRYWRNTAIIQETADIVGIRSKRRVIINDRAVQSTVVRPSSLRIKGSIPTDGAVNQRALISATASTESVRIGNIAGDQAVNQRAIVGSPALAGLVADDGANCKACRNLLLRPGKPNCSTRCS